MAQVIKRARRLGMPAEMPAPDEPVLRRLGSHLHTGKHDVTDWEWGHFVRWLRRELNRAPWCLARRTNDGAVT